jgi:hypothetical protein
VASSSLFYLEHEFMTFSMWVCSSHFLECLRRLHRHCLPCSMDELWWNLRKCCGAVLLGVSVNCSSSGKEHRRRRHLGLRLRSFSTSFPSFSSRMSCLSRGERCHGGVALQTSHKEGSGRSGHWRQEIGKLDWIVSIWQV